MGQLMSYELLGRCQASIQVVVRPRSTRNQNSPKALWPICFLATSAWKEDLVDQLFNSSEKRLARLLLLLANFGKESKPIPVVAKISQETLAEMIGTTRSRVSFFMNRFRKMGFLDLAAACTFTARSSASCFTINAEFPLFLCPETLRPRTSPVFLPMCKVSICEQTGKSGAGTLDKLTNYIPTLELPVADQKQILILGQDGTLLALRKKIFKMRGFSVATMSNPAAALDNIMLGKFALVLLAADIPELRRNALAGIIKGKRPEIPLVMLYAQPAERDGLADAFSATWSRLRCCWKPLLSYSTTNPLLLLTRRVRLRHKVALRLR